jgi:anaerobic magnesium-protoporphyrin IX monomethyl ester cyclase
MAKVTLVQMPYIPKDKIFVKSFYNKFIGGVVKSFTLPMLASYVKQFGHEVEIFLPKRPEDLEKIRDTDAIGFTLLSANYPFFIKSLEFCDKSIPTIVGGPHASFDKELMKSGKVSSVVVGEGENALLKILEALDDNKMPKKVYSEPVIGNLDSLPYVDWGLVDAPRHVGIMCTSRGCPFGCNFCITSKLYGPKWRGMSAGRILDEIEDRKWKIVWFSDDNFILNPERVNEFLNLKEERGLEFSWFCFGRCDTIVDNPGMVKRMKENGCFMMFIGIESMSDKVLNAINKRTTKRINKDAVRILKENGIGIWSATMLGPYDTEDSISSLVAFLNKINPVVHETSILTPFLGTDIYYKLKKEGRLLNEDWGLYDGAHCVYNPYFVSAERLQNAVEDINEAMWEKIKWKSFAKPIFMKNRLLFGLLKEATKIHFKFKNESF